MISTILPIVVSNQTALFFFLFNETLDAKCCFHKGSNFFISFTKRPVKLLSCVRLFAIPQTVAYQVPPSMEFSRQEYWSGLPFPSLGDLPDPEIARPSPTLAEFFTTEPPGIPTSNFSIPSLVS